MIKNTLTEADIDEIDLAFKEKLTQEILKEKETLQNEFNKKIEEIEYRTFEKLQSYIQESSEKLASIISKNIEPVVEAYFQEHRQAFENEQNVIKINNMMEAFKSLIEAGKDTFKKIEEGEFDLDEEENDDLKSSIPSMSEKLNINESMIELNALKKEKIISEMCDDLTSYQKAKIEEMCEKITYLPSIENSFRSQVKVIKDIFLSKSFQENNLSISNKGIDMKKYQHLI